MSIKLLLTTGFGNGTFNGTIKDVVTMGYTIGVAVILSGYLFADVSIGYNVNMETFIK